MPSHILDKDAPMLDHIDGMTVTAGSADEKSAPYIASCG